MCSLTAKLAKFVFFLINIGIWVCGAVIMGVGIALAVDEESWSWFDNITGDGMSDDLLASSVYIMITVGVLLFLVGFVGCCGVWKDNTCMLQTYIILVCILLVLELTGAILAIVFKDSLEQSVQDDMFKIVNETYAGVNSTETDSVSWNSMQQSLECCGAYNHTDYEGSNWRQGSNDSVPVTCCKGAAKLDAYYTISAADKSTCMSEGAMAIPVDGATQLYTKGCYQGLGDWIDEKSDIIIGVLIGLGCVQLFGLIVACCTRNSLQNE